MSVAVVILGDSGAGKTTSLRNLDPAHALLIQALPKALPFRVAGWGPVSAGGNVVVTDNSAEIVARMRGTRRDIVVLDDFQFVLANEFMARSDEKGYDKFTEIGRHAFDVLKAAPTLPPHKRVYLLAHTHTDDYGRTRMKTLGRMLDEKIGPESMFTIVLRAQVINGQHVFSTRNSGSDTVKTPIGLFEADHIPNDLAAVDAAICAYYSLTKD